MTSTATITAGAIFSSSWGYDQTNIDYYQVTRATAKTVWLRPIAQTTAEVTGSMSETVQPVPDDFTGDEFRRKVKPYGPEPFININECAIARLWNGAAQHQSHWA